MRAKRNPRPRQRRVSDRELETLTELRDFAHDKMLALRAEHKQNPSPAGLRRLEDAKARLGRAIRELAEAREGRT